MLQRIGNSKCIRCNFETDPLESFEEQDRNMMTHLNLTHPGWMVDGAGHNQASYGKPNQVVAFLDKREYELLQELSRFQNRDIDKIIVSALRLYQSVCKGGLEVKSPDMSKGFGICD